MRQTSEDHLRSLPPAGREAAMDLRGVIQHSDFQRLDNDEASDVRRRFQAVVALNAATPLDLTPATRQQALELLAGRVPLNLLAVIAADGAWRHDCPAIGLTPLIEQMVASEAPEGENSVFRPACA